MAPLTPTPERPRYFLLKWRLFIGASALSAVGNLVASILILVFEKFYAEAEVTAFERSLGFRSMDDDKRFMKSLLLTSALFYAVNCLFAILGVLGAIKNHFTLLAVAIVEKALGVVFQIVLMSWGAFWKYAWLETLPLTVILTGIFLLRDVHRMQKTKPTEEGTGN